MVTAVHFWNLKTEEKPLPETAVKASPGHLGICTSSQFRQGALPKHRWRPAPKALHTGLQAGRGPSAEMCKHVTWWPQAGAWLEREGWQSLSGLVGGITHLAPRLHQTVFWAQGKEW